MLITGAFFFSALTGFTGKFTHGAPVLVTVFVQYAVSFVLFLPSVLKHLRTGLRTARLRLHVVRSLSGASAQVLFFLCLAGLPLLAATLLSNTSPLFIPLIVLAWLRKPVERAVWLSLGIGIVGVVLVIRPGPATVEDPASLIALASSFLSAVGLATTNALAETEPPYRILFYNFAVASACLLPCAIFAWRPIPSHVFLLLVLIGIFFALTQWLIILAYRCASATALSPFNYSVVIFSGLLGWLVLHNAPGWSAIAGTLLICAGGILSIELGHREGLGHPVGNGHWRRRDPG